MNRPTSSTPTTGRNIFTQPDGGILVGGTESMGGRRFARTSRSAATTASGGLLETIGAGPADPADAASSRRTMDGCVANPDGSVTGAGWTYGFSDAEKGSKALLARFVPGAGSEYDPSFGEGVGLVRQAQPPNAAVPARPGGRRLVRDGDKLLVAGRASGTVWCWPASAADGVLDAELRAGWDSPLPLIGRPAAGLLTRR